MPKIQVGREMPCRMTRISMNLVRFCSYEEHDPNLICRVLRLIGHAESRLHQSQATASKPILIVAARLAEMEPAASVKSMHGQPCGACIDLRLATC